MSERFTSLQDALLEITRLQGVETQFNTMLGQIPGGDITAHLSEFARRGDEEGRLTRELATITTRATTAEGEVTRLTGELATVRGDVQGQAEHRAAEIVAGLSVPPAAAETAAVSASGEPANFEEFRAEYARLQAENPVKGGQYHARWFGKFNR